MSNSNTIRVVCRFRPPNATELREGGEVVVDIVSEDSLKLNTREYSGDFTFDRVFDADSKQNEVFDYSIKPTVDDVLNGYNGTVFAYGQTGSGKTYTMMGSDIEDAKSKGVIPRIIEQVFQSILASPASIEYTVRVSFMEIYMERIRDLLNPAHDNLPVHEEKSRGVYVKGLLEIYVSSVQEVLEVMRRGSQARAVASTNMNNESSRSHSIFVVNISQKNLETGSTKSGQLFLVDLAGSEKVGKTGASGQTLEEAKKINKSLSTLGMVINALTDNKSTHVPYRDSKLTRILQESLGGNSRTTLIVNCSPCSYNDVETLSTLRFGTRAKTIKNRAKINAELSPMELKNQLRQAKETILRYEDYIASLEKEVTQWRSGKNVDKPNWTDMASRKSKPQSALSVAEPAQTEAAMDKDEREEFFKRENELQDQISDKESQITEQDKMIRSLQRELESAKASHAEAVRLSDGLHTDFNEIRRQLERTTFEGQEAQITIDALKEANAELGRELDSVRQAILKLRMGDSQSAGDSELDLRKSEKLKQMLTHIESGDSVADNMHNLLQRIKSTTQPMPPELMDGLNSDISAAEQALRTTSKSCKLQHEENTQLQSQNSLLTQELEDTKTKLESLLKSQGAEAGRADAVKDLETLYASRLHEKDTELEKIKQSMEKPDQRLESQMHDFDKIKSGLMLDLQSRCERIVELEIALEEAREQHKDASRASNDRGQQKKMAFLERNLEQLTGVQRQLIEQNSILKKDIAIANRKLSTRNERIEHLEMRLQETQDRVSQQSSRFESQLQAVRERLEQARATANESLGMAGSRIAKPLRGGQSTLEA